MRLTWLRRPGRPCRAAESANEYNLTATGMLDFLTFYYVTSLAYNERE